MPRTHFYDIESLSNVFTLCEYQPEIGPNGNIDVYYLVDSAKLVSEENMYSRMCDAIYAANDNFRGTVRMFDLHEGAANIRLARTYGLSNAPMINNPLSMRQCDYRRSFYGDTRLRIVCDTDPEYDPERHAYIMGYNSYNYDSTMLARYLELAFVLPKVVNGKRQPARIQPPSAYRMRKFNDLLFSPNYRNNMPRALTMADHIETLDATDEPPSPKRSLENWGANGVRIRKNMLLSGRHLDVARLNEKQRKVGLKRLLGTLGMQILESDRLGQGKNELSDPIEFYDLVAYNVSDVVNLHGLFMNAFYQGQFSLKRRLLQTYPELVYDRESAASYTPVCDVYHVRSDRLCIDSSSAQFATKCLCPYDHLDDQEYVSFMYPSEQKAKELGIQRRDILEESREFFEAHFPQPELRAEFMRIYNYYANIRGKNFNSSSAYKEKWEGPLKTRNEEDAEMPDGAPIVGLDEAHRVCSLASPVDVPPANTCLFYYDANGDPTSCYVNFSVGGIHGLEYDRELFNAEHARWEAEERLLRRAKEAYPDPLDLRVARKIEIDGKEYPWGKFIRGGVSLKRMNEMTPEERQSIWKDLAKTEPNLFEPHKKTTKQGEKIEGLYDLKKRYAYTSTSISMHEDFSSYYPSMLINMSAFQNDGLGYDRYAEIYNDKQRFGKLMKDPSLSEEERRDYAVQREGTKLILNSASGAANATFENNILMANNIISMRIIGQLMAWRIGQAQAYEGSAIVSTNTDGLYSCMDDHKRNNEILFEQAATIGIEIEPEPMWLISKDANNRMELQVEDRTAPDGSTFKATTGRVFSASGNLACWKDTNPTKALAHPAIMDWALVRYMQKTTEVDEWGNVPENAPSLDKPFDRELGMEILKSAFDEMKPAHLLRMFGNIVASSPGTMAYVYATKEPTPTPQNRRILQHYNRAFLVREGTPNTIYLHKAQAKKVPATIRAKRRANGEMEITHQMIALDVLRRNGVNDAEIPDSNEAQTSKVPGIEPTQPVLIDNRNLDLMSKEDVRAITEALDLDTYLELIAATFEKNWKHLPRK